MGEKLYSNAEKSPVQWQSTVFPPFSFMEKEKITMISITEGKSRKMMGYDGAVRGGKGGKKLSGVQDVRATQHVKKSKGTARAGKAGA